MKKAATILYLALVCSILAFVVSSLTSCQALKDFDFNGQAAYIFEDGSKARIVGGSEGGRAEYWKKVGDSWIKVGTELTVKPTDDK